MGLLTRTRAASGDAPASAPTSPEPLTEAGESRRAFRRRQARASRRAAGEWTFGTHLKTRAVHALLVVAFVSGPVALLGLGVGLGSGSRADVTTAPAVAVTADPGPAERASAAAERLVNAWLSANRDDVDALQTQLAQPVTDLDLQLPNTRPAAPTRIWIDDLTALPDHRWTVTVGALTGAAGTASYYTVPVQTDELGAVALTLPARTTGAVKAAAGALDGAGTSLSLSDPAAVTAAGYLAALTGGTGDIDRWTSPSPSAPLPAISPAPCRTVKVQQVQTTADPVPAPTNDGVELGVLVTATCTAQATAQGADPVVTVSQYPLLLRARGSRWEVAGTNPTLTQPAAKPSAPPSPEPSATPSAR